MVRYPRSSAFILAATVCLFGLLPGCADSNKRPETAQDRQDQMLKDPMGYKIDAAEQDPSHDISGGSIGHFDKDAFKKDVNNVFSP
jgi:hypothetical protein